MIDSSVRINHLPGFQPGATPRNKLPNKNIKYELARYSLPPRVFRTCILYPFTFLRPKFNLRLYLHLCVSRLRRISLKHRKEEVRKSERHVSLKRGARESVHPSARWSLFTMTMLIPRVFSNIDPNFTISMRSTNFSFFFPSFLSLEPLVVRAVFLGTVFPSVVVVVRRQVVGKKTGEWRVGYNGVRKRARVKP